MLFQRLVHPDENITQGSNFVLFAGITILTYEKIIMIRIVAIGMLNPQSTMLTFKTHMYGIQSVPLE